MTRSDSTAAASPSEETPYGDHPEQRISVSPASPDAPEQPGTVALLHGGYWRGALTSALMDPMARDLAARGWTVANIEYRRVDAGGGWPLPVEDAVAACERLIALIEEGSLPAPLLILGHSVGGQLALLAARELRSSTLAGVVALAPVTDVVETWRAGLGDDAARELLAASTGDPMRIADAASPRFRLPIGAPIRVVHGADDVRVPLEHSRLFASLAEAAGDDVRLHAPASLEHRAAIDPTGQHWPTVLRELHDLAAG